LLNASTDNHQREASKQEQASIGRPLSVVGRREESRCYARILLYPAECIFIFTVRDVL